MNWSPALRVRALAPSARRGFTLIELLVVIAIIALLIGILLPALGAARQAGQRAASLSNVRQMGIAMNSYALESKDWFPLMPFNNNARQAWNGQFGNRFLTGQQVYGGVAGLFSLNQIGQGSASAGPPSLSNPVGYRGTSQTPFQYANGSEQPILADYISSFEVLTAPNDREDRWYGTGLVPQQPPSWENAPSFQPEAPGGPEDVIGYNISYMYLAGLKLNDPKIVAPPPLWGDDTNGYDVGTDAWWRGRNERFREEVGYDEQTGYSRDDNNGADGSIWTFADGHAEFFTENPDIKFFGKSSDFSIDMFARRTGGVDANGEPNVDNATRRSSLLQTLD